MPNAIERDVYVLRNTLKNPISYVRGTDLLPIIFHFRDFTIPSGATATAFTAKPDGNAVYGSATISENDVTVDVQQQMFIVLGLSMLQVEIKSGEETLATFVQPVMVEPNLKAGDFPPSTTDINFLDEVIEQSQEAVNNANQAIASANTAIEGANTAASSANQAAENANNTAQELLDKAEAGDFNGPKGDTGDAATVQVGTVQTLQPGENAEVTNSGTANAAVLNFKIPRGADGMTDLTAEYKDDSSYTCQPTVNAPVVVKGLDGKTEQVETTGAQLFDMENYDFQTSRCTISKSSDYIIFTATAADAYFGNMIVQGMVFDQGLLPVSPNTEYTVTISNSYFTKNYISFLDSNKIGIQDCLNFTSQSQSFTTPDNCAYILLRFGNEFSVNGDTERFQIMLNKGSTALPWEPYTGAEPSPSPDYPQVIKGVGGMGYFDGEWVQGNISSTGAIGTETTGITSANAIPCKQNDNIAVAYEDSIDAIAVAFYNASGAYISTSTSGNSVDTFTATAPANAASFKVNLRVVSGSTITPNGAKYCTVTINGKHQTGVEVHGAQLLNTQLFNASTNGITAKPNADGSVSVFGTATKEFSANISLKNSGLKAGTYYVQNNSNDEKIIARIAFNDGSGYQYVYSGNSYEFNDFDTYSNFLFQIVVSSIGVPINDVIYPMLSLGSTALPWEPYHHTSLSIPLTSPLYEGDKICYVKPGESYVDADGDTVVADRILYGVYRENAVVVLDGSEDEVFSEASASPGKIAFRMNDKAGSFYGEEEYLKCDKLKTIATNISVNDMPENSIKETGTVGDNVVFIYINEEVNTVQLFKTWLQSNPLTVLYKLAQPYFEPFTDQSILYGLRTDDTLSYVYSNDPIEPVLTVEVAKNSTGGYLLESYAQAQKNAISEASSQSRLSAIEQQLVNQATTPTE